MSKSRPTYTDEFRRDAVDLLNSSGKPVTQIARELGVSTASLRSWRTAQIGTRIGNERGAGGDEAGADASAEQLRDENSRLRKELSYMTRQRDILKKAASILADDPGLGLR